MWRVAIVGAFAVVPLAAGCRDRCAPGPADPTLAVGWGEEAYEPLDATTPTFVIVSGPQGGWHVPLAFDATGLDGDDLMASHLQGFVGGVRHGDTRPWVQMRCNARTRTLQSWNNLLVWDVPPDELHGQTARIDVEITDLSGRTASASVEVVLVDPVADTGP